eukprot:gene8841-18310_t
MSANLNLVNFNYKGRLQELLTIKYKNEWIGPDYFQEKDISGRFTATVTVKSRMGNDIKSFQGDSMLRKKDADQSAAEKMLAFFTGETLNPVRIPDEAVVTVVAALENIELLSNEINDVELLSDDIAACYVMCRQCTNRIGSVEDFFFACKSDYEVEFAIKPTFTPKYHNMVNSEPFILRVSPDSVENDKNDRMISIPLHCKQCDCKVGNISNGGIDKSLLTVFGKKKISFELKNGSILSNFKSWADLKKDAGFRAIPSNSDCNDDQTLSVMKSPVSNLHYQPLIYPNSEQCPLTLEECLSWTDLLANRNIIPKEEQLAAFRKALVCNHIVILPTGFGKTLIACLVIHRMVKLNPSKLAILVVDRVPLVHQQKSAIEKETGLFPCGSLCSETGTVFYKRTLSQGNVRVIVATAGSLIELLKDPRFDLRIENFSMVVFDECHHATRDHVYNKLLKMINDCPLQYRPRLLGLSASPCKARTVESALNAIRQLQEGFGGALLYRPAPSVDDVEVTWKTIEDAPEQAKLNDIMCAALINKYIKMRASNEDSCSDIKEVNLDSLGVMMGRARSILEDVHSSSDHKDMAKRVEKLIIAVEINELLGPFYVKELFRDDDQRSSSSGIIIDPVIDYFRTIRVDTEPSDALLSSQLLKLEKELSEQDQSTVRALIFVDTTEASRFLLKRLSSTFSHLNPDRVIGHGGGMRNITQKKVLDSFRTGKCQLIVCTSVLEEGLDVQSCNLVLRVGARSSLIQFVQSRGRARAAGGRLVVFLNSKNEHLAQKILQEERHLAEALYVRSQERKTKITLHNNNNGNDDNDNDGNNNRARDLNEYIDSFISKDEEIIPTWLKSQKDVESASFKMFLTPTNSHNLKDIKNNIIMSFRKLSILTIYDNHLRLTVTPGIARNDIDAPVGLFDESVVTVICNIPTSSITFLQWLMSSWSFEVQHAQSIYIPLTRSDTQLTADYNSGGSFTISGIRSVSAGYFVEENKFIRSGTPLTSGTVKYESLVVQSGRNWTLESHQINGSDDDNSYTIRIQATITTIGPCIFISGDIIKKTVTVYLIVKSAPTVLHKHCGSDRPIRVSLIDSNTPESIDDSCDDIARNQLKQLSGRPIIAIEFDMERWNDIVEVFSDSSHMGQPCLITRILALEEDDDWDNKRCLLDGLIETETDDSSRCQEDPLVVKALLAYACLESNSYQIPLNPRSLRKIFTHVKSTLSTYISNNDTSSLLASIYEMQQMPLFLSKNEIFMDGAEIYNNLYKISYDSENIQLPVDDDDEFYNADRIFITPARIICKAPIMIKSNRLTRFYGKKYRFFYVKFRDEQCQPLFSESVFATRYLPLLENGFDIQGLHCEFLACSASQMRE